MAWNNNPEVRSIGAYAKKYNHDIVVAFVIDLKDFNVGYVSYGRNAALCHKAKVIGDALLDSVEKVEQAISKDAINGKEKICKKTI